MECDLRLRYVCMNVIFLVRTVCSYAFAIKVDTGQICDILAEPQDVHHLFACPAKPTNLDLTSLIWSTPKEAAETFTDENLYE
ncbi:hypothetical protein M8J75_012081 [Diaphorina citri]|nr:hypothetical protein M8J75_012081 [Diaphorina citri]